MDEEAIWKRIYEKMDTKKEKTNQEIRLQEIDGGFFEKFGSQLKEQVAKNEGESINDDLQLDGADTNISEKEEFFHEDDELCNFISDIIGFNVDELYTEVLYEISHLIGSDLNNGNNEMLFDYLQTAFKFESKKHGELLEVAKKKEPPSILLNIEIVAAKDLKPKDANGMSDPYCTLYLSSVPTHRYNTSVKSETLNPVWEEHFSLPIVDSKSDTLCVEVWDFDPAETVKEKMSKITEVKGVRGLSKLMKEIAVTASTGRHDNEVIGLTNISLKTIPLSGSIQWYSLEKKPKPKSQGFIKINLRFSSEKNNYVAAQEHRHLLRLLLLHELENMEKTEINLNEWSGEFKGAASIILKQHLTLNGLTKNDELLAKWTEFTRLHINHSLSYKLFDDILIQLVESVKNQFYTDEETKIFWDSTKKIVRLILININKIKKNHIDAQNIEQLKHMLNILKVLSQLKVPDEIELFSPKTYKWLDQNVYDIKTVLELFIKESALNWFHHVSEVKEPKKEKDSALKNSIKVVQQIRLDLQKSIEYYDNIFLTSMDIYYSKILFEVYDKLVDDYCEPIVFDVCSKLKPIKILTDLHENEINSEDESLSMGTSLFELYLILQKILNFGYAIHGNEVIKLDLADYHNWFHRGVAQWLDIAVYKALKRIQKAVELDNLIPVDSSVKYSSSAVDTLSIFYQIKIFWNQLSWPDVEGSYTFIAKILDDICRCSIHYADTMSKRVDRKGESTSAYGTRFDVTNEWCLAINNIDYVRESIQSFMKELSVDDILDKISESRNQSVADTCRKTLNLVTDNAADTINNKIIDLMETVSKKMSPVIRQFLLEKSILLEQENSHVDRLMQYLDDNLMTLHSHLNNENFDRILLILWESVFNIMSEVIESGLEKKNPPTYFDNLYKVLDILIGFFKQTDKLENNDSVKKIKLILKIQRMETENLIHHFYLERFEEQKLLTNAVHGMLTVKAFFKDDLLTINVMNARNLLPHDSNGSCDPYVKIHFLPREKYINNNSLKIRTKTQKKILFPLFDESFSILVPEKDRHDNDLIHFIVKDEDFMGMTSQFVGESFISFVDIPKTNSNLNQIHMKLNKPINQGESEIFKAIERRQGEKLSRDFIKRQKNKVIIVNGGPQGN